MPLGESRKSQRTTGQFPSLFRIRLGCQEAKLIGAKRYAFEIMSSVAEHSPIYA